MRHNEPLVALSGNPRSGRWLLPLAAFLLLAGCGPKQEGLDEGKLENGVYKNQYFDLVLPVPAGWEAKTPPQGMSRFLAYYLEVLAAKDKLTGRVIPMVRMASAPIETMGKDDVFITLAAARVGDKPGFNLMRAVEIARIFLDPKESPTPVRLIKDFYTERLGHITGKKYSGLAFAAFEAEWTLTDGRITEACYIVLRRDYALVISIVAKGPKGLEKAKNALKSIRWSGAAPA